MSVIINGSLSLKDVGLVRPPYVVPCADSSLFMESWVVLPHVVDILLLQSIVIFVKPIWREASCLKRCLDIHDASCRLSLEMGLLMLVTKAAGGRKVRSDFFEIGFGKSEDRLAWQIRILVTFHRWKAF